MILLDLTGTPRQSATCANCGSRIDVTPADDRAAWERTLPRLCEACYLAQDGARDMEEP